MYTINYSYTPCVKDEHKAVQVERHVEADGTSIAELSALGDEVNELIAEILEGVPERGKLAFASRACRYMMENIRTK